MKPCSPESETMDAVLLDLPIPEAQKAKTKISQ
jgi:hypothetical protein